MKGSDYEVSYYRICEYCGSHLDPGETCDCKNQMGGVGGGQNSTDNRTGEIHEGGRSSSLFGCIRIQSIQDYAAAE